MVWLLTILIHTQIEHAKNHHVCLMFLPTNVDTFLMLKSTVLSHNAE